MTKTVSSCLIIHPYGFASLHMTVRNPYGRTSFDNWYLEFICYLLFGALIQKLFDFMDW